MTWRLDRVALNVHNLDAATRFYCDALGFVAGEGSVPAPELARLLGVRAVRLARLRRGSQTLELSACEPSGAPMVADGRSNDLWFQHCALVTGDIAGDYERVRRFAITPISRHGPQTLAGGVIAWKFRDPEGHPLELISFASPDSATQGGIDHSAISVADPRRSAAFYAARVGLAERARQINRGPAQDALDDLDGAVVDVVALSTVVPGPHVELLSYRQPRGRSAPAAQPSDIVATRLVFAWNGTAADGPAGGTEIELLRDPDGHSLLLERGA